MLLALRNRPVAVFTGPFWLSALCAALAPTTIGYQDLAAFLVRQPGVSERWRDHMMASPFGTIHAATFRFSRPIGTAMSEPIDAQTVNFDPRTLDVKVWIGNEPQLARPALHVEYPAVNRRLKGDRMPAPQASPASSGSETLPPPQPIGGPSTNPANPPVPIFGPRPKSAEQIELERIGAPIEAFGSLAIGGAQADDVTGSLTPMSAAPNERDGADDDDEIAAADQPPEIPATGESSRFEAAPSPFASPSFLDQNAAERNARLFFGRGVMGSRGGLERWAPGAEPVPVLPSLDPDIKLSALEGPPDTGPGGETVAGKDDLSRLTSPAERLGLAGKPRAKEEKCLADAVYFEARGEPLRGQMAVAQVVMNRVFSGFYPNSVCGVVYQNANRHLACQFTFACEGKDLSRIDELDMWEQAKRIAKDMLDGKIWLTEVGLATHYHAYWVHPSWVHEMKKMYQLGVHTFYRPRAWGDGSDAPVWGGVPAGPNPAGGSAQNPEAEKDPSAAVKSPEAAAKIPQAAAAHDSVADKDATTARL
jgi:hypothetical protein